MRRPVLFWGGALGALGLIDYWCAKNTTDGDSLSECTRTLLRTDTATGAAAFVTAWSALSMWLVPHIVRPLVVDAVSTIGAAHVHPDHTFDD